jgi:small-conductance mechanosensitive channel
MTGDLASTRNLFWANFAHLHSRLYTLGKEMTLEYRIRRRHSIRPQTVLLALTFLFLAAFDIRFSAQTSGNTAGLANQAEVSPTPVATPIPVSAIVSQAEAATVRLRGIRPSLAEKPEVRLIEDGLTDAIQNLNTAESEANRILADTPTLGEIRAIETEWREIVRKFSSWKATLREQTALLDRSIDELDQLSQSWRLTISSMSLSSTVDDDPAAEPTAAGVPDEIRQVADETLASINETRSQAQERRTALLTTQTRVSDLESRASGVRDDIRLARERTLTNLFRREEQPIWAPQSQSVSARQLYEQVIDSLSVQAAELRTYFIARTERFVLHAIVLILITAGLYWARRRIRPYVEKEPKLEKAAQIFSLPAATGLILTIVLSSWFYPRAPLMLTSLLGAAALVPVVVLLRQMVERPLFIILNALIVLYFVDLLREILVNQPYIARYVFMAEMLGAMIFLLWFLKSKTLSGGVEAAHYRIFKSIRRVIPYVLTIFAIAFIASALGFVSLANVIGNGVLGSAYLALVIYTAVQIIRGLIIFALRVPPLAHTLIVKNNRPIIRERSIKIVRWLAVIIWALLTLNLFSIREPIFTFVREVLLWSTTVGTISFSLGSIGLFLLMIWIAVLTSRFLRFVLEEDLYPRVALGDGVTYAVSTLLHYSILVVGFMIAVGVLGVDFTNLALIAGAVGIGIGFGLQNIINNFVSGLILLFERPVKIGDVVQLDAHTGTLRQIGLRASVLRKVDGSDVIVPNSMLISEAVINWTMSDKERRIDIPVGVAYGNDPEVVIDLLIKVATGHSDVLIEPAPKVIFIGFGDNSLDFEVRVWTDNTEGWVGLRSHLMTGVYTALTDANIEIPFPQRDLHLRSVSKEASADLGRDGSAKSTS